MKRHICVVPVPKRAPAEADWDKLFETSLLRCEDCDAEAVGMTAIYAIECTRPDDASLTERRGHWIRIDCGRCHRPGDWTWFPEVWMKKGGKGFMVRCSDCLQHESDVPA